MRQRIVTTGLAAIAAGAMMLGLGSESRAENVRITVAGTVATADPGMGYTVGQPVSFFWEINDFSPTPPVGTAADGVDYLWEQYSASDPQLWSDAGGTGLGGMIKIPTNPYEYLWLFSTGELSFELSQDDQEFFLAANPDYKVRYLFFEGILADPGLSGFSIGDTLPNPASYFGGYFGEYDVEGDQRRLEMGAVGLSNGSEFKTLQVLPTRLTIAPVPEPSTWLVAAGGLGGAAWVAARRRTR